MHVLWNKEYAEKYSGLFSTMTSVDEDGDTGKWYRKCMTFTSIVTLSFNTERW